MGENNGMTCAELADVAAELALGVLTGRERAMAVAHLDTCDACREDVRQLMATGEQLLELLPPAEPSAGFETRVLARLGPLAPPGEPAQPREPGSSTEPAQSRRSTRHGSGPRHRGPAHGWTRRVLAAAAVVLAVTAAGLGGWRIGVATAPGASPAAASPPAGPLTSARLLSAAHRGVGHIFLYSGTPRWLYMSVDLGSGDETVTCQLVDAHGRVTTLGSFWLAGGYGSWGSPAPGNVGDVTGARLVSAAGAVLATATFPHG